jgi:hypothetical protein
MSSDTAAFEDMWAILEMAPTEDRTAIRRAYARRLKLTNPEDNAIGFATLRTAYEAALAYADASASEAYDNEDDPQDSDEDKSDWDEAAQTSQALEELAQVDLNASAKPSALMAEFAADYAEAQMRLEAALDSATTEAECLAALNAILFSPLLDKAEGVTAAETWLTLLIVDHRPHSDAVIKPVIAHFNWTIANLRERELDAEQRAMRRWICRRGHDLSFLRAISRPDHEYHNVHHVLSQPPQPTTWQSLYFPVASPKRFAAFLARVRRSQPTLLADLNADTVKQWDQRLSKPQLPLLAVWMSTIGAICLVIVAGSWFIFPADVSGQVTFLLGLPIAWAACHLALIYGYARPRLWWKRQDRIRAIPVLAYGWAPMSLVLLLLAPLPSSLATASVVVALSLFTAWWVVITGDAEGKSSHWPWFIRVSFGELPLGLVCMLTAEYMMAQPVWQMMSVWMALSFVSCFGGPPLRRLWETLNPAVQRRALLATTAVCLAAIVFLWLGYADDLLPWCFSAVAGPILLHRVPATIADRRYAFVRRVILGTGTLSATLAAGHSTTLPALGTLLLAFAAFNSMLAWPQSRQIVPIEQK